MKNKTGRFACDLPNRLIVAEGKGAVKKWIGLTALAGLTVGMFFAQSCSASAKAGPNDRMRQEGIPGQQH